MDSFVKQKIVSIVNVFETGSLKGRYDSISIYKDGPVINGEYTYQITYGKSQTTEFGNLRKLIELYVNNKGKYHEFFTPYLSRIGNQPSLRLDKEFKAHLKKSALEDPIMVSCQDEFFDILYFQPAVDWFQSNGFKSNLAALVIYDSFIHSGGIPTFLRNRFPARPPKYGGKEEDWIEQYVNVRHAWLANHSKTILRKTIYRTSLFKKLIKENNWKLEGSIKVNGLTVP